jgi:hypothetical protein
VKYCTLGADSSPVVFSLTRARICVCLAICLAISQISLALGIALTLFPTPLETTGDESALGAHIQVIQKSCPLQLSTLNSKRAKLNVSTSFMLSS